MLGQLQTAIHRRDVFTSPSWRYADPRANLLSDAEWEATRLIVCRTLGLPPDPQPILDSLAVELDRTYREVTRLTGLNAIPVPGTLRDSLVLHAVVLEQQTELKPTRIMTDTGAYSDVMFGLFRHLGYRFCPRLADIGGTRFWRIDPRADYGKLNVVSQH